MDPRPPCLATTCGTPPQCLQPQGRACCILASSLYAAGPIKVILIKPSEKRPLAQARLCSVEANSCHNADTKSLRSMEALKLCWEDGLLHSLLHFTELVFRGRRNCF